MYNSRLANDKMGLDPTNSVQNQDELVVVAENPKKVSSVQPSSKIRVSTSYLE